MRGFLRYVTLCLLAAGGFALVAQGAQQAVYTFVATTCTNQFIRSIAASGAGTCATVALGSDVSGTLPIANGGTADTGTAWSTFTPTITCGTGTVTSYTTQAGRQKTLGKTTWVSVNIQVNNIGTCSGLITINGFPTLNNSATAAILFGRDDSTGQMLQCRTVASDNKCAMQIYDGTNVTATHVLIISGTYEAS
jgi:hypothetical protein